MDKCDVWPNEHSGSGPDSGEPSRFSCTPCSAKSKPTRSEVLRSEGMCSTRSQVWCTDVSFADVPPNLRWSRRNCRASTKEDLHSVVPPNDAAT